MRFAMCLGRAIVGRCRLNTLLLYHGLSVAMAVYVSVNTLMSDGSRRIADGGDLSVSLITGFLTHLSVCESFFFCTALLLAGCNKWWRNLVGQTRQELHAHASMLCF